MPQSLTQKVVNTFVKGLITEASELTFPENASVDELNCDLRRDGSRRRRLAAKVEDSFVLSSFTVSTSTRFHTGKWENVGGQSGLEFLVLQVGSTLRFYNKIGLPYSSHEVAETVNLSSYEVAGGVGATNANCQFASINGALVVSSPAINTIYIQRDNFTGVLTTTQITFRIRDFEWLGDKSTYSTQIATGSASAQRKYDTANAGWSGTKGTAALTAFGAYPPLTLPWYAGKDTNGDFSKTEWEKVFSGTSLIGNGTYILNFFSKDRTAASGIAGITTETENSRFKAVESFAGRIFYAGLESAKNSGSILFSRQIESLSELGECFQVNDPTSEEISDLLPTDGGVIRIPDAVNIKYLYAFGANLFIFADNGVWSINGVDNVFRATEYSLRRVSYTGMLTAESFVEAEGVPFWWSKTGIHTLQFDEATGSPTEQNISLPTIQTFWDNIGANSRSLVQATYDRLNKKIYWAYPNATEANANKLNNFLILDIPLGAFYPWKVSDEVSSTDYVMGLAVYSGYGSDPLVLDVVLPNGDDVVQGTDDVVSTQLSDFATGDPSIVLLLRDGATGKLTMGSFSGGDYLDWGTANYTSFAEAGYDFLGDLMLQKTAPYIIVYSRVTEEGWTSVGAGYEPIHPSSLLVSAYWDFSRTASSTPQQAYRYKTTPVVDPASLSSFGYPETVITTRLKVRGRGRSMRMRFESEQGKDFVLLGYGVLGGRNNRF
ncbi:hypothetical protein UFOVP343_11 [uncultured Caudovirales phage]|uniref:Uncharacterized protein n=1 Tax=uncultured Caudovirales phage TaxID=2100421 RepID=A0A6J5M4S0_9CAUD|nr:hypothetical protein UFOVP343_11 [uncultured Caudovirales phage]